jgi:2-polyprenyl-3-methyl-5-hydroxy-6-metoxy-1,4-benzoquinol methylase
MLTPDRRDSDYSFDKARSYWGNVPRAQGANPINTDQSRSMSDGEVVEQFQAELAMARQKDERKIGFKRALELVEDLEAPRVMDYGSGAGFYGHEILRCHEGARVTFVDINPNNLAMVERISNATGLGDRADYTVVTDPRARNLEYPQDFDVIMSMGVLHHTPHARAIVARITSFLKPGGIFLSLLYNPRYWKDMARSARRRINTTSFGRMTDPSVDGAENPYSEPYDLRKARRLFEGCQSRRGWRGLEGRESPARTRWKRPHRSPVFSKAMTWFRGAFHYPRAAVRFAG